MHIVSGKPLSTEVDHIYLDMDGVLCDLHKALFVLHGRPDLINDLHDHDIEAVLGLPSDEIWFPVMAAGWEFWEELEPFPWTFELWAWAHEIGQVAICSRPLLLDQLDARDTGYCVRGKMAWLRRHFGRKFREVVFTPNKHAISQRGVILVDDDERYEADFNRRGGRQLIFPRPYNRFRNACQDPMDCVRHQFDLLRNT